MQKCYYCQNRINNIPYSCLFCGMIFCSEHRLPEKHNCDFSLNLHKHELKYLDALGFQEKKLTVADIYHLVTINELRKSKAIGLLKYLIHNEENVEIKLNCIDLIELLELKSPEIFILLEELILSENNRVIREKAIKIIKKFYPMKSKNILKWMNKFKLKTDKEMAD